MPDKTTAESFLLEMARDLNGTVKNADFNRINVFKRRRSGDPIVGEIIDIDILGPDDGSVILAELGPTYFVFQTIECPQTGTHPENGSRAFDGLKDEIRPSQRSEEQTSELQSHLNLVCRL